MVQTRQENDWIRSVERIRNEIFSNLLGKAHIEGSDLAISLQLKKGLSIYDPVNYKKIIQESHRIFRERITEIPSPEFEAFTALNIQRFQEELSRFVPVLVPLTALGFTMGALISKVTAAAFLYFFS